jgi:hypothetical protein
MVSAKCTYQITTGLALETALSDAIVKNTFPKSVKAHTTTLVLARLQISRDYGSIVKTFNP